MAEAVNNTDREIWRKYPGDFYSPSIHMTAEGNIGINVGGYVIVRPVEEWHEALRRTERETQTVTTADIGTIDVERLPSC